MNASTRKAHQILRDRRRANRKRSLSTHVAQVTESAQARKTVTAALRKVAKALREGGDLGRVQCRIGRQGDAKVIGPNYRYTAAQAAMIASVYRPRKAEYVAVRNALTAA